MSRHGHREALFFDGDLRSFDEFFERPKGTHRVPSMMPWLNDMGLVQQNHHQHYATEVVKQAYMAEYHGHQHRAPEVDQEVHRAAHHNYHRRAPEAVKSVHLAEDHKYADAKRGGEPDVQMEKGRPIDTQADGFIREKHRSFELSKWDTFKM